MRETKIGSITFYARSFYPYQVVCHLCNRIIGYAVQKHSTARGILTRHLKAKHPAEYKKWIE